MIILFGNIKKLLKMFFQIFLGKYIDYQEKLVWNHNTLNPYFVERAIYEYELSGGTYEIKIDICKITDEKLKK